MISYVKAKRRFPESAGDVVNRYEYTGSWGDFELTCPSQGKGKPCIPNRYTFTAREWDPDALLYYYRARWYDREIKRFTGEDKFFSEGDRYNYSINNPLKYVDPSGYKVVVEDSQLLKEGISTLMKSEIGRQLYLSAESEEKNINIKMSIYKEVDGITIGGSTIDKAAGNVDIIIYEKSRSWFTGPGNKFEGATLREYIAATLAHELYHALDPPRKWYTKDWVEAFASLVGALVYRELLRKRVICEAPRKTRTENDQ